MREEPPKQGFEGALDAWLEVPAFAAPALDGFAGGGDILIATWLRQARRDLLKIHPRSPHGLHRVTVRRRERNRLPVGPIEAIDGTLVADIKPVLPSEKDS
jgi:tRNA (Thr-GGU) A37 N-methylase